MKYKIDYGIKEVYNAYRENCKIAGKKYIARKLYSKILKYYNTELCKDIVYNSNEFRIPFRIGYLRIKKCKQHIAIDRDGKLKKNHLKVNWLETKKLWENCEDCKINKKLVYHLNTDTNGYYYKWTWNKSYSNVRNVMFYNIEMTRTNKRAIAKAVKKNENLDYYE